MRTNREEWKKRVERWQESGLTAEQYASELGINAGTLKFWTDSRMFLGPAEHVLRTKRREPKESRRSGKASSRRGARVAIIRKSTACRRLLATDSRVDREPL